MSSRPEHILVTGGAGFIGSALTLSLLAHGYEVTVVDNLANGSIENIPNEVRFIEADLMEESTYREIAEVPFDAVFHLASQSSGALSLEDPMADMKSHLYITFSLLQLSLKRKVSHFMFSSSTTLYGDTKVFPVHEDYPRNPNTYYAAGKLACDYYIQFFF